MASNIEIYKLLKDRKYMFIIICCTRAINQVRRDTVNYCLHKEHEKDHEGHNWIYKLAGTSDENDELFYRVHSS